MGTRGDIEPFLAVGEVLSERGWEVVCLFPEQFRRDAEAMGFRFHGFSAEFLELIQGSDAKEILGGEGGKLSRLKNWFSLARKGMKLARESVELQHRVQIDEVPDRIVYHPKCKTALVWGLANPRCSIMLSPIPGLSHPVNEFGVMWGNYGRAINRASYWLVNTINAVVVNRFTRRMAKDYGDADVSISAVKRAIVETEKTIYTVSPSLFPRPEYWPPTAQVVGYFERDKTIDWTPDKQLLDLFDAYDKIVFISFGSMANNDPRRKTETIVNVLRRNKIPAIINTSWGGLTEIDGAPEHVLFVDNIPYDWLFPRVHAVVHHGGSGSTHMAIKYGCPSLVVPHALDQPFWARIVHEKGLGPQGLSIGKLSEAEFESRLIDLCNNEFYKHNAEKASQQMAAEADRESLFQSIANSRLTAEKQSGKTDA